MAAALEEKPDMAAGEVREGKQHGISIHLFKYHIETEISIPIAFLMGLEHNLPTMSTIWGHGGW